jgi:hypothetical protein
LTGDMATIDLGAHLIPDIQGLAELFFDFTTTNGEILDPSATAWMNVVAAPSCTIRVDLPW